MVTEETQTSHVDEFYARKFEKMQDFNLIYLTDFEALPLPQIIPGKFIKALPEKVFMSKFLFWKQLVNNPELPTVVFDEMNFRNNLMSHEGIVYKKVTDTTGEITFETFEDTTAHVKEVLSIPEIAVSIETLTGSLRRPALSRDLLSLPGFGLVESEKLGDTSLSLKDDVSIEKNSRKCTITLTNIKDSFLVSVDLGVLNYSVYRNR